MRRTITAIVLSVLALPITIRAADSIFDDKGTNAPPVATNVLPAQIKRDAAVKKAQLAYHEALVAADKQQVDDLSAQLNIAMGNKNLDEVKRLDLAMTKAKADLHTDTEGEKSSTVANPLAGVQLSTPNTGEWPVTLLADGTIRSNGPKSSGEWALLGKQRVALLWRQGYVDILELDLSSNSFKAVGYRRSKDFDGTITHP
jgi:hypothetical protein